MLTDLSARRALVTGGAQGLGRAIATLFAARGARVMIADIDERGAARTAGELGDAVRAVRCDVTHGNDVQAAVQATVDAFGGLDVLVNNAGVEVVKPLFEQTEEDFARVMNTNVKGVFLGMKYALAALSASGRGVIVNMASLAGVGGVPLFGLYCASKAAVIQLTRVAAAELRATGIRVNAVCPAFIDTAMVERLIPTVEAAVGMPFDQLVALKQGRLGTPEEVAEMVAFLASDDAAWTTGAHYVLDGGLSGGLL
jgi:NAD(P)-dependent dehydrogenase (short-subunit alcohol dehydrogenase family)